ncbi:hypothetical protein BGZ73_004417 [Actinomortierella ambigua]|nr:hypothetical protein BGZ73_004417 [Actinomortierella ambigua]
MLDWPFPESLDNGYEEFAGSAGRDFGSTTMLPRSFSTTTATLALSPSPPPPATPPTPPSSSEPSSSAATVAATATATATTTSTTATLTTPSSTSVAATTASTTPTATGSIRAPVPSATSKGGPRSIAKASSSAPGTMTDLPSISMPASSSSTSASPATRQSAFRRRRPVASTLGSTTTEASGRDASKSLSLHLDDRPTYWWYTKGCTSIESDFVLISEFSEIEGPRAVMTIPDNIIDLTFDSFAAAKQRDGGAGARPMDGRDAPSTTGAGMGPSSRDQQRAFDVHEYVLRITSVDHQSREMSDSFHIPEDIEVYICESEQQYWAYVHHFTLFDVNARGFVRPFNISYITKDPNKILPNYEDIRRKFSKAVQYFKMGNYALFRHELTRKLKDLHYTHNILSEGIDAPEKPAEGPKVEEQLESSPGPSSESDSSDDDSLRKDSSNTRKTKKKSLAEAGSSLAAIESTKAELASIKDATEQATQIISMLEHYSIDGQPLLGYPDENGESVHATGAPAPLSEVSPMNSSENLASIASGRSGALNDMSLFLGAQGRSGLRIRRKGSTQNVARILDGGSAATGIGGGAAGGGAMLDNNNLSASSPLLSGLQEQSRKNSIVSEYESSMLHEPEYEPQFITSLYPVARDEIVFRTLRELCVTPMFWNSSLYFHLGIKKLKDILKDYHDDALLLKQTAEDLKRMYPTRSSLTVGHRFQINLRNPDFTSTAARPSSPPLHHHEDPSPGPLMELLHGISTMANTLSDDGESTISMTPLQQRQRQPSRLHPHSPPPSNSTVATVPAATQPAGTIVGSATASAAPSSLPASSLPASALAPTSASVSAAPVAPPTSAVAHFDTDDADDEQTGYDSLDDTSSFFTAVTGGPAGGPFMDMPARDSMTVTSMDRSARVVEWRQEQHSLRHKRSSRALPPPAAAAAATTTTTTTSTTTTATGGDPALLPGDSSVQPVPTTFDAGVSLRDLQQQQPSFQRLSDGHFGSLMRPNRLSSQSGMSGAGTATGPGGASGYAGGGLGTTRIPLSGSLVLKTLQEERETAKHILFALWSGKQVCITGGIEHEARIRQYVAVLSVFVPHVGYPTREEQLLEHQRQVVPWHQGYDLLRTSDFTTTSATTTNTTTTPTTNTATTKAAGSSGSSPPPLLPYAPPLLLVGVDRARLDPAVLERADICTVHLDTQEMVHAVDYTDGLVIEKIFRSLDQGLFSDDGSFLAFVDSTLFELLLKAFLYYHLVLCHRIFQHPHLLHHRPGGGSGGVSNGGGGNGHGHKYGSEYGGGGYGFQPFYSSACSDDGETFSYLRQYRRPSRPLSPTSSKMATIAGAGGKQSSMTLASWSSKGRGVTKAAVGKGGGDSSRQGGRAVRLSSRDSSDTEKTRSPPRKNHAATATASSHMDWTRRIGKRTSKGKDRYRQSQQHKIAAGAGAGFMDESADEEEEDEEEEGDHDRHGKERVHPMQYMTSQGMHKWRKWFDYLSAKGAAVIDPALAVFGKPENQKGGGRGRERTSRPSSRRSSPSGHGHGHRRAKTMLAAAGANTEGGYGSLQQQHQQYHQVSPRHREHRERHEREKERDRRRDRERDSKAAGAHFDHMRHYSDLSNSSDDAKDEDEDRVGGEGREEEGDDEAGEIKLASEGCVARRVSSSRAPPLLPRSAASPRQLDMDKDLPSLPASRKASQGDGGDGDDKVEVEAMSQENLSPSRKTHHNHHHPHMSSAVRRLQSVSPRKLQPKVPLSLQPIRHGDSSGGSSNIEGTSSIATTPATVVEASSSHHPSTTSPLTSPTGSSTLRGLTSALRAMSLGSAFGSPTTTTSTTAVITTAASGSTVATTTTTTTTSSSPSPPSSVLARPSSMLSPTFTRSQGGSSIREGVDRSLSLDAIAIVDKDKIKRRGSKRAKAKAWLDAKRKKHWHRHGSKGSAPCTADEEEEGDYGEGEEDSVDDEEEEEEEQRFGGETDKSHGRPGKEHPGSKPNDPEATVEVGSHLARSGGPVRHPSDHTITGVEAVVGEDWTVSTATSKSTVAATAAKGSPPVAAMADMLTIEEIAQLEPTVRGASSTSLPLPPSPSPPPASRRFTSAAMAAVGDISGRESATEYETSMETWATNADRQKEEDEEEEEEQEEEASRGGKGKKGRGRVWEVQEDDEGEVTVDAGESTATPAATLGQDAKLRPNLEADPYELTEETLVAVKEMIGGVSGDDDWEIIVYLAKLVNTYEKIKEATANPSSDK